MICDFSNVACSIFGFQIHWYSLAYIFGIILALKLSTFLSKVSKIGISGVLLNDFVNFAVVGIIIGGRVGHVLFYDFDYYARSPIEIFKIWKGGMSFYGGFIGVIVVAYWFCKKRKISFLKFMDLWSVSVPIGLFFGRIANFINGELLGIKSSVPWNVVFRDGVHRHPSQLYEAFLEGAVLLSIMLLAFKGKLYKHKGMLSGLFCNGYGMMRFFAEFFREPDSVFSYELLYVSGFNLNHYMSLLMFMLGSALIIKTNKANYG